MGGKIRPDLVREMLTDLGEDPDRDGLLSTPDRVASAMRFLTQGYHQTVEDVIGSAIFERKPGLTVKV